LGFNKRGQWLFFLSAQTYFEEGWLEEQLLALETTLRPSSENAGSKSAKAGTRVGLIGCKLMHGATAERVHSAGLDVAVARRFSTEAIGDLTTYHQSGPGNRTVFPYRRLEGAPRADRRLNVQAAITAPSSLCFIADKRTFTDLAGGLRTRDGGTGRTALLRLDTPFLQVLDLSLRLQRESDRSHLYLPTHKVVVFNQSEGSERPEPTSKRFCCGHH